MWSGTETLCRLGRKFEAKGTDEVSCTTLHRFSLPTGQSKRWPEMVTICLASSDRQRSLANALVTRRYAWRGYGTNHRPPAKDNSVTFTALLDEEVTGTLTLAVDSPAGLAVERTFEPEVDLVRRSPGARICELTRFAFDPGTHSKRVLAALFHTIFIHGSYHHNCTDLLIEVNPRHVRFYEVMLGFERFGPVKANASVSAPAQLMRLKVSEIRRQIDHSRDHPKSGQSLYPYFFCENEEQGVFARMLMLDGRNAAPVRTESAPVAMSQREAGQLGKAAA